MSAHIRDDGTRAEFPARAGRRAASSENLSSAWNEEGSSFKEQDSSSKEEK